MYVARYMAALSSFLLRIRQSSYLETSDICFMSKGFLTPLDSMYRMAELAGLGVSKLHGEEKTSRRLAHKDLKKRLKSLR